MVAKKNPRLSDKEVVTKARWILEKGFVKITTHFRKELQAANATFLDVERAINDSDCRVVGATQSTQHGTWKYKIEGCDEEGYILQVVFSIDVENSTMTMITAM